MNIYVESSARYFWVLSECEWTLVEVIFSNYYLCLFSRNFTILFDLTKVHSRSLYIFNNSCIIGPIFTIPILFF